MGSCYYFKLDDPEYPNYGPFALGFGLTSSGVMRKWMLARIVGNSVNWAQPIASGMSGSCIGTTIKFFKGGGQGQATGGDLYGRLECPMPWSLQQGAGPFVFSEDGYPRPRRAFFDHADAAPNLGQSALLRAA